MPRDINDKITRQGQDDEEKSMSIPPSGETPRSPERMKRLELCR